MGGAIGGQAIAMTAGAAVGKASEFYRPDVFMLLNGAGALKAAQESWKYSRELKKRGLNEAAKEAKKAFLSDVGNFFVSLLPLAETVMTKSGTGMATWGVVIPAAIGLTAYSNKKIEKARGMELETLWRESQSMSDAQKVEYTAILANQIVSLNAKLERLVVKGKGETAKARNLKTVIRHRTKYYLEVASIT